MSSFRLLMVIGGTIALAIYWIAERRGFRNSDIIRSGESFIYGMGIAAGAHLLYCCFVPSGLVHLVDQDHRPLHTVELFTKVGEAKEVYQPIHPQVELSDMHFYHLLPAALVTLFTLSRGFALLCMEAAAERKTSINQETLATEHAQ